MKKFKCTLYVFIFLFTLLNLNLIQAIIDAENNLDNYFRLHIVANSDSINDQMIKLKVANEINNYISVITKNITNKSDCIKAVTNNIPNLLNISKNVLKKNNSSAQVVAYIGNIKYGKKEFNKETMPPGTYTSLKINIGEAKGSNWWSLISPTFSDTTNVNDIWESDEIKIKSKILELIEKLFK